MISVDAAFMPSVIDVDLQLLLPSKQLDGRIETGKKFNSINASIREIGIIEPLSVSEADPQTGRRVVFDGHARLIVLKRLQVAKAPCIEAVVDETFTYNAHVNRMSTVQESFMLRRAIDRGVSPERLARALNARVVNVKKKAALLDGICDRACELLKDRVFSPELTELLRKMQPARQVSSLELMISVNTLTVSYARGLLYTTAAEDLVIAKKPRPRAVESRAELERLELEAESLRERYRSVEKDYAQNMLHLTIATAYVAKLLDNREVSRYLRKQYPTEHEQLAKIVESGSLGA